MALRPRWTGTGAAAAAPVGSER